jgi:hypothetical protein
MSRHAALVVALALASFVAPATAFAQLPPQAGAAGAGSSAISGVPFGPANPSVLSDPSGIGNASRIPPLTPNTPAPPNSYGALSASPPSSSPSRVVTPSYASESPRISAYNIDSRKAPARRRGRAHVGTFTGICRGC